MLIVVWELNRTVQRAVDFGSADTANSSVLNTPLNDVLLTSVDSSMGNEYDGVIVPLKNVDCSSADTAHDSAHNTCLNDVSLTSVDSSSNNKDNGAIVPDSVASSIDYRLADTTNGSAHSIIQGCLYC